MPCSIPYPASKGDDDDGAVADQDDDEYVDDDDDDDDDDADDDNSLWQASCGKRTRWEKGSGASLNCVALLKQILYYKYKQIQMLNYTNGKNTRILHIILCMLNNVACGLK